MSETVHDLITETLHTTAGTARFTPWELHATRILAVFREHGIKLCREEANRRKVKAPIIDALMSYWLQATHEHEELREWWELGDGAADAANEMSQLIWEALQPVFVPLTDEEIGQ